MERTDSRMERTDLKKGVSTGSCATAAAVASVLWQQTGHCPEQVLVDAPIGYSLNITVETGETYGLCWVKKDAGDDPDVTDGAIIEVFVRIEPAHNEILFEGGNGVGIITEAGLKLPVGEPAINPVPRKMITEHLRPLLGDCGAVVHISIPNGEELAKRTMNPRLGIIGGLSILGTTGIVRPMSEEAMKDSLVLELQMRRKQGFYAVVFTLGTTGERALIKNYGEMSCMIQVSNYIGFMLDEAMNLGFTHVLIGGFLGKLVKLAANIMNTHSHVADGRNETICTFAALEGASKEVIQKLYRCKTTSASLSVLKDASLMHIFHSMAQKAEANCMTRCGGNVKIGISFLDNSGAIISESSHLLEVLEEVRK